MKFTTIVLELAMLAQLGVRRASSYSWVLSERIGKQYEARGHLLFTSPLVYYSSSWLGMLSQKLGSKILNVIDYPEVGVPKL